MNWKIEKQKIWKLTGVFFAAMVAFTLLSRAAYQHGIAVVTTQAPAGGTISHQVVLTGKTVQNQEQAVTTEAGLRIAGVYVNEGQQVKQGDVLFALDLDYLDEEILNQKQEMQMLRRSWDWEYQRTTRWLDQRISQMATPKLTEVYNTNLFFCIFYSTGLTLDTEELVCATSRGTRYYVSAAYWDRDVLLWAFPAILDADPQLAEEILRYVFGRQRRNLGIHSRYIDGTVLEPGFELDELMAPVIALESYVNQAADNKIMHDPAVMAGIQQILKTLETIRHPEIPLYETFLQPTDDEIVYPYLTYNNVLV